MSAGASSWCEMVQLRPVATMATIFDRDNAIEGNERERDRDRSDGSTARAAVGLQATDRTGGEGVGDRTGIACVGVRPTAKKSTVIGLQFSRSWSQRCSRRASEAITPSALSPPDMPQ